VNVIADLGARIFEASYGADNLPENMVQYLATNFSTEQIRAEIEDPASTFFLVYGEGQAVGYARLLEGENPSCVGGTRPVQLVRIYVEQGIHGKGYGSALMNACLEAAESNGNHTIWLGVWEKNQNAIGFYEKWGFEKVGLKEFALGNDLQADHIMARSVELVA
jgi:ribosomal protein S18 acetylase RimI-like enzyme